MAAVNDQYGLLGLLKKIKANDRLLLGHDLNKMGLDFANNDKRLHKTFWGPWTWTENESPANLNTDVPHEYQNVASILKNLPELKMVNLAEDVLFYLFYNRPGEPYQLAAASELIRRDWRFHKVQKMWIIAPLPLDTMGTGGLGKTLCYMFDPIKWRKETKTIDLHTDDLGPIGIRTPSACRDSLSPSMMPTSNRNQTTSNGFPMQNWP